MSFIGPTAAEVQDFAAAQDELRTNLGTVASFGVPSAPQWPAGTAINPDTGVPYDPLIVQSNAEFTWTDVTVLIIEKQASPMRPQADTNFDQAGMMEGMDIILDVATVDYEATVQYASRFAIMGKNYDIEESKPFAVGNQTYRWVIYGAER